MSNIHQKAYAKAAEELEARIKEFLETENTKGSIARLACAAVTWYTLKPLVAMRSERDEAQPVADTLALLREAKTVLARAAGPNAKNAGMWKRDVNTAAWHIATVLDWLGKSAHPPATSPGAAGDAEIVKAARELRWAAKRWPLYDCEEFLQQLWVAVDGMSAPAAAEGDRVRALKAAVADAFIERQKHPLYTEAWTLSDGALSEALAALRSAQP